MRIACLHLPDFIAWAARSNDPELVGLPLAIGGVPPARGHGFALSPEAREAGLEVGMSLTQAQAVHPKTHFLDPDDAVLQRAERRLIDLLLTFTPCIESHVRERDLLYLDTHGLERLYADEMDFARQVRAAVRRDGYPAAVGLADTKLGARIAAREARGGLFTVAIGGERAFLGPLPLAHLSAHLSDGALLGELHALGLRTIADLAELPAETLASRFGPRGRSLLDLARGQDDEPFQSTPLPSHLEATVDLDEPLGDLQQLTAYLQGAVDLLSGQLAARGFATTAVRLTLELEDGSRANHTARFARPTLSTRLFLDCLRLGLDAMPLAAPIASFRLEAHEAVAARAEQLQLFVRQRAAKDPNILEEALARLRSLLGPTSVASPRRADTHRPEREVIWEPYAQVRETSASYGLPPVHKDAAPPPGPALRELPARILETPQPIDIRMEHGQPHTVGSPIDSTVDELGGPHRLTGDWWGTPFERDYYNLTMTDGNRYWVFHDRRRKQWFLQGLFD